MRFLESRMSTRESDLRHGRDKNLFPPSPSPSPSPSPRPLLLPLLLLLPALQLNPVPHQGDPLRLCILTGLGLPQPEAIVDLPSGDLHLFARLQGPAVGHRIETPAATLNTLVRAGRWTNLLQGQVKSLLVRVT